jgi:hypothetical protein
MRFCNVKIFNLIFITKFLNSEICSDNKLIFPLKKFGQVISDPLNLRPRSDSFQPDMKTQQTQRPTNLWIN